MKVKQYFTIVKNAGMMDWLVLQVEYRLIFILFYF
jgi:hypothetical protein